MQKLKLHCSQRISRYDAGWWPVPSKLMTSQSADCGPCIVVFDWITCYSESFLSLCICKCACSLHVCLTVGENTAEALHNRAKWLPLSSLWLPHECVYLCHRWMPFAKKASSCWRQSHTKPQQGPVITLNDTGAYLPLVLEPEPE